MAFFESLNLGVQLDFFQSLKVGILANFKEMQFEIFGHIDNSFLFWTSPRIASEEINVRVASLGK